MLARVFERARRVWRDKVAGPTLRTYDAACDELGGEPWRALPEATDRWFLADRPPSFVGRVPGAPEPSTPDTGTFDLRRRMSGATKLALLGGLALVIIAIAASALATASPAASSAAPLVTAPVAAPVAAPPAHVALPAAPVAAPPASIPPPPGARAASPAHSTGALRLAQAPAFPKHHFAQRRRR